MNDHLLDTAADLPLYQEFEGCYLKAYRTYLGTLNGVKKYDVPTIGYGHTTAAGGMAVSMGMTIDQNRAEDLLRLDLIPVGKAVLQLVKVQINANEFGALRSFTFNLGAGALKSSTLLRRLNAGDYGITNEFNKWIFAQGIRLTGLVRRRAAEARLWDMPA